MQASSKERKAGGSANSKKRKKKDDADEGDTAAFETPAEGGAASVKGTWDWHKCFVLDCKRISDRYLKDLKDRNICWVHTCASHRTMQDKARRAYRGKEGQVLCHVCFGLNESTEIFSGGKIGTPPPGATVPEEFLLCKTCKQVQERIVLETGERKVARNEAQDLKKELWQKLSARLVRTDRTASQPLPLAELGLTDEGDVEDESAERETESGAGARQSEPTSEVELSREAPPPAALPPSTMPAPAPPSMPAPAPVPPLASPLPAALPPPLPAPSAPPSVQQDLRGPSAPSPVPPPPPPRSNAANAQEQGTTAEREAEALRLREEIVQVIESHLRKGAGAGGAGGARDEGEAEGDEDEDEAEADEELQLDGDDDPELDDRPRATSKAKNRK